MFLKNCWYVAAESAEIGRQPVGRVLLGEPVVLFRKEDGTAVALEDRCCHRRAPLHKGRLIGDALQCGYHGFTFAADGALIKVPGHDRLPVKNAGVRAYPVVERHHFLWIWMGDAAAADPARIHDFHENDDPAWATTGGLIPVAANYLLLVDNLLDLSHVGFVHSSTIGSDDTSATLDFERRDGGLHIVRAAKNIDMPPHMRRIGCAAKGDMTKTISFSPGSNIAIDILWAGHGGPGYRIMVINSITPETERTSHYFWANARDFDIGNDKLTAYFREQTIIAFTEDKVVLEAQQKNIELDPGAPEISVHGDWGGVNARRMMAQLIAEEGARRGVAAQ
jgi:phenylpropionate dioxygenase-like ring-hydroxylating dioxygenase large terminal subunit